ncbi:elongation factor 1 alpha-like protein, partial [Phenoliferia sp. Uapishka_3]
AKQKKAALAASKSQPSSAKNSRPSTPTPSGPKTSSSSSKTPLKKSALAPQAGPVSQLRQDLEGMNLVPSSSSLKEAEAAAQTTSQAPVVVSKVAKEKILEQVREKEKDEKPVLSLVVVGHVDAGKSTLMGRLLHELGVLSDRALQSNQRQSEKIGKGSFAYAWTLDATDEERERGVTIDVAIDGFETPSKRFTLIDAPGHRDFIPNMISGAAQADTAVLVIDGSNGGFEKGFEGNGQTREHAVLVRSLGVQQLVVAINKLDAVRWAEARFENIKEALIPFLSATGFHPSKVFFVPVGATSGENVVGRENEILESWYNGPTLVQQLDQLDVPKRSLEAPLRIPVSNVFRGQSATASGLAISGRIESGIVQVGEELAALPGDGVGVVRSLEVDGMQVPWAVAGVNVTIFLAGIDPRNLSVGSILCPTDQLVPVVSTFSAQIIVFDLDYPIPSGASVELFHFSKDVPATISSLDAILDKVTGAVTKTKPRMLTKGTSARIHVQLRNPTSGPARKAEIPLETFAANKSMGRVLFRRAGVTIAAGIVLEVGP